MKKFSVLINLKQALAAAVGNALFMSLILGKNEPIFLIGAFVFGALGGSLMDYVGFKRNNKSGDNNDN